MILIYSPKTSQRLYYITNLIFHTLLELDHEITQDINVFHSYDGPKINYSNKIIPGVIHIPANVILFENEVRLHRIEIVDYRDVPCIFSTPQLASLPYDPFAASFYLVSRYEEYLPFRTDSYGRFKAERSLAYKKHFLQTPVVNHYALHIKEVLLSKYPSLKFPAKSYQFILTYDIDIAYSILEKGFVRSQGALLKALVLQDKSYLNLRKKVLKGDELDPYDTFDYQIELSKKHQVYPIYFFHLGNYGKIDKSIKWTSQKFQELIKKISSKYLIGLHPSAASNDSFKKLETEIDRLNSITNSPTERSRQHYIILEFPLTYQNLYKVGIKEDYSMGYPDFLGFRASICTPYNFYDLKKEESTSLMIYPFCAMDSTMHHQLAITAETALLETKILIDEVRKVNGTFIFVAHNNLIGKDSEFKGFQESFEEIIQYAKE